MSTDIAPAEQDWPKQSWFLRSSLLSTVTVLASVAALVTELCVMLIAGTDDIGPLGVAASSIGLLIIFRARWAGLALMVLGAVVCALFAEQYVGMWTVVVFSMFLFAKQGTKAVVAAIVVATVLYLVLVHRGQQGYSDTSAIIAATFILAAAASGSAVRLQTQAWDAARQRAIDLAAAQAAQLRGAVTDERLRIARDLHDVVGHELAVVNINVGVAEVFLPPDADEARRGLTAAREGLQRTLHEMQQILDLLRDPDREFDERAELALVEHIPSLVDRVATAGGHIEAQIAAELPSLDADVSAAAYRIVQEALTNAEKHGTGTTRLSLSNAPHGLVIDVENRVVATVTDERVGYGLIGMRERVHSAGGSIDVSRTDGLFRVHVELPMKASRS